MQSIKELYKIGNGPSSSHTMGPEKAARLFKEKYSEADFFEVTLYGSLALTGKGHLTDYIIKKTLSPVKTKIMFNKKEECKEHPNTLDLIAYKNNAQIGKWRVFSVGGGTIKVKGQKNITPTNIYKEKNFSEIKKYCLENNIRLYNYVYLNEGQDIKEYLRKVWKAMQEAVETGLNSTGIIPGKLKLQKRAKDIYNKSIPNETPEFNQSRLLAAYSYAVSETNASGGVIVTAPTCGASGVLPAVLYYMNQKNNYEEEQIINSLATAAIIGNIVKTNASISGAKCGCQAEIGTACSMASAAIAELKNLTIDQIEASAEIAMEHHLGLTCDPIYGYVQIPCIERNAVAAMRSVDAVNMSLLVYETRKIFFDTVVETMYETGKDLHSHYRETSEGGLAKKYCRNKYYNDKMMEE